MLALSLMPHSLTTLLLLLVVPRVLANPATVDFRDCIDNEGRDTSQKVNISSVYAQVIDTSDLGKHLNLTVLGTSPHEIVGFTNTSGSLTTLFTQTAVLTLSAWSNSSYFCSTLRPPSPLRPLNNSDKTDRTYCPVSAGPFGFSTTVPWGNHRALTTLTTTLRAVDPDNRELFCIDVITTPLDPEPNFPYGRARAIFWCTVVIAIGYWVVVGVARIASAWGRGITRRENFWSRARSAGFILASATSGERMATSPALMRFCTPSMRDVFFHTQWCAVLAMVAVQWPPFAYPLLTQTAWSTLSFNVTLLHSAHHWNPLYTAPYNPPQNFVDQLNDRSSPLFINTSLPNILYTLPANTTAGIPSFAYTIGVRPQDLFPICMILFLGILAAAVVLATFTGLVDHVACLLVDAMGGSSSGPGSMARLTGTRSPGFTNIKDTSEVVGTGGIEENKSLNGHNTSGTGIFRTPSRFSMPLTGGGSATERGIHSHRVWWRFHVPMGSFHGSVLQGNLVRILVYFHLPVTIFSIYQLTLSREIVSVASKTLAGLSFGLFSALIPAHLVLRVWFTTTNKLYAETNTLLCLGPLYNHYRHGSQLFASLLFATNLVFGVTIGAGQHNGTAQAIIILIVEVASALVTSIWLPWGTGASMGLISFLFCVARIVVAVLLVILTPKIDIGAGAAGWVAYGILVILALVFLALALMLIVKVVEGVVRIAGGVGFDRSKHIVDSGILGACGLLGCCGPRKPHKPHKPQSRRHEHPYQHATPLHSHSQQKYRDSDGSYYVQPALPNAEASASVPRFQGSDSRKGSTNSGPPPSVLKPEHAMRPYKEDDEDEGFIMGSWQRIPKPGYAPVFSESPMPTTPVTPSQQLPRPSQSTTTVAQSGFSRIGGGRAHIDSPYAIASGSTYTFPSIGRQSVPPPTFPDVDDSPPPSLSTVNNYHQDHSQLPPGAMQPSHARTKSQSAIIEDASLLAALQGKISSTTPPQLQITPPPSDTPSSGLLRPPVLSAELPANLDEDSDHTAPKKKPWYRLIRTRPSSSDGPSSPPTSPPDPSPLQVDEELGGLESAATPSTGRSFVVIRKPQSSVGLGRPGPSDPHATT